MSSLLHFWPRKTKFLASEDQLASIRLACMYDLITGKVTTTMHSCENEHNSIGFEKSHYYVKSVFIIKYIFFKFVYFLPPKNWRTISPKFLASFPVETLREGHNSMITWNYLPDIFKVNVSFSMFKSKVRNFYLEKY